MRTGFLLTLLLIACGPTTTSPDAGRDAPALDAPAHDAWPPDGSCAPIPATPHYHCFDDVVYEATAVQQPCPSITFAPVSPSPCPNGCIDGAMSTAANDDPTALCIQPDAGLSDAGTDAS